MSAIRSSPPEVHVGPAAATANARALERRGRVWLVWSFLLCPCHLSVSLTALAAVLGGTSVGVMLRDNTWRAGALITAGWLIGTTYGLWLIRRAGREKGGC